MANSYKASMRKAKKKQQVNISHYPFINPIICIKDESGNVFVLDGQYRLGVCKLNNVNPECIIMEEGYDSAEFWEKYHIIRANQKEDLEKYFKENKSDFSTQILWSSSDDKMQKFIEQTRK